MGREGREGLSWLDMRPEDFDEGLLPRKYRGLPPGLFPVSEVLPAREVPAVPQADGGQMDLFSEEPEPQAWIRTGRRRGAG